MYNLRFPDSKYGGCNYYGGLNFNSIMMYSSYAGSGFAINTKKPVMVKSDGSTFKAQRSYISLGDIKMVEHLYGPYIRQLARVNGITSKLDKEGKFYFYEFPPVPGATHYIAYRASVGDNQHFTIWKSYKDPSINISFEEAKGYQFSVSAQDQYQNTSQAVKLGSFQ